jgi:GTP:adenosylcobinamide-phosphate guanylyltransferase
MTEPASWTALVLAGSRRGEGDPVARYRHVRHKSLATAGGVPLLVRVVRALTASPRIGRLLISVLTSAASLSRSVADGFTASRPPLLVTTADHALLDPRMLAAFLDAAEAPGVDVAAGMAPEAVIAARFPETRRTYLRFRDGGYSGANLFALRTPAAERAIAFWERVERDRKQPWRLARALGPALLVGYLLRRWTLDQAMARVSKRLGIRAAAVAIPIAEAAIDIDKPADLDLVEAILAAREAA